MIESAAQEPVLRLPYPVSANRYWRTFRGLTARSKEANEYKRTAAHSALVAGWRVLDGPVHVAITLHPKRTKAGKASATRMDLDNCIKVTLDALNGVAYLDDRQVIRLVAEVGDSVPAGGLSVSVRRAA